MATTPCTRHHAHVWMAYCSDCTNWHLSRQRIRRDRAVGGLSTPPAVRHLAR